MYTRSCKIRECQLLHFSLRLGFSSKLLRQNVSFSSVYIRDFSVISKKAKKSRGTTDYKRPIKKLLSVICVIVNRQNVENTSLSTHLRKNLFETKKPIVSFKLPYNNCPKQFQLFISFIDANTK